MTIPEFFEHEDCSRTTYLGDGVYAGQPYEGTVILAVERTDGIHYIYLSELEFTELARFMPEGKRP